jgi:hypothetical protein
VKNCETVGSAVRSNTSAATRATADFNLLDHKKWHTLLKSGSNSWQNPISAECVQIASNAAAPDARENN